MAFPVRTRAKNPTSQRWTEEATDAEILRHDMEMWAELDMRREKRRCERSLRYFVEAVWPLIDSHEFVPGWHIDSVCMHLQGVADGTIKRLLINYPPRAGKTSIVMAIFPVWIWIQRSTGPLTGAHVRFLCASYNERLGLQASMMMRRLIASPWFQARWGRTVRLRADMDSKTQFDIHGGGSRLLTSVGGTLLGLGGDIILVDDPQNVEEVESDEQRETAVNWFRELSTTRLNDQNTGAIIVVMQRLHRGDVAGHILSTEGDRWCHLMIPLLYDPTRAFENDIGWIDPRQEEGELMDPVRFSEDWVEATRAQLGPYMFAGRMQQSPTDKGGGIIKREWWRLWPDDYPEAGLLDPIYFCPLCKWSARVSRNDALYECPACSAAVERHVPFPEFSYRLLSVDTAYGEKKENSYSAATCWGIWHDKYDAPRAMLITAWRGRPRLRGVPDSPNPAERVGLVERIYQIATQRQVDAVLIEHKSRGQDLYQELQRLTQEWPFQMIYGVPTKSKAVRMESCVPLFTGERVWAPDKEWAETVMDEVSAMPKGDFDDLADSVSMALRHLRDANMLSLGEEFAVETRRSLTFQGRSGRFDASEAYEG